jgi:hypothetical protein
MNWNWNEDGMDGWGWGDFGEADYGNGSQFKSIANTFLYKTGII